MNLYELTIAEAAKKLQSGEITSAELIDSIFERIENLEPKVKAYLTLFKDEAIEQAKKSDERRSGGKILSDYDGIPISVKDLLCLKGKQTTAASNILKSFVPPYDSTVVNKLKKAGFIIIGKNNLDAFAHGSSTENSDFGPSKNPWDTTRVPGGSSGGSAAAVASDMALASIGTDTGGSIRQPASLCGVVGLKPTYGRVSRYGVVAMASSLDVVGPITKTVEDAAILMEIISGRDDLDSTTIADEVPQYLKLINEEKPLKIGVPKEYFAEGIDPDVKKVIEESIVKLKENGAEIVDISLPSTDTALSVYYILQPAEVSSNLGRYDGVRYGYSTLRENKNQSLDEVYFSSRGEGFGDEAKRRIMLGTYVLSAGYYDAYYRKALKLRTLVKQDFEKAFEKVDVILTPVSPTPAFKFGEKVDDPIQMYLSDIYTVPINPAGVPAISVPAGFVIREDKKLPVGVQIIGAFNQDATVLNVAHRLEKILNIKEKPQI